MPKITTRHLRVPEDEPGRSTAIDTAARILRAGGLVAFPTETVYGLGANALDATAVGRIFTAKDRPAWDPLIVHVASREMLRLVAASLPPRFDAVLRALMPGPLTVLVPKADGIPDIVTAGRPQVAVRIPSHPVALALIMKAGVPIAAPSANRFGHPSPTEAAHVLHDLAGRIDAVLDAGPTRVGVESTVIDISCTPPLLLRPGGVARETIESVLGPVDVYEPPLVDEPLESLPSPGAGIRHYAPRARLMPLASFDTLRTQVDELLADGLHVGVLDATQAGRDGEVRARPWPAQVTTFHWGTWGDWDAMARSLFAGLRTLDARGVDAIVCVLPPAEGLGLALRDRLTKASRK